MRTAATAILLLVSGAASWAQHRMGGPQFGPPPMRGTVPFHTFVTRRAATINAFLGSRSAPIGFFGQGLGIGAVVVPYPYPFYLGGAGDPDPQPASAVRPDPAPEPDGVFGDPAGYFLALRDGSIWIGLVAHSVKDGTLHYTTAAGNEYQVPLDQVDRDLSAKLNRGRQVQLQLPPENK